MDVAQFVRLPNGVSWVQPLHFTMVSSEIRDIYGIIDRYEVCIKEVRNLGFEHGFRTQDIMLVV